MKEFPEPVVTGGLMGQGFGNLLGRPHLATLPLVLREAVQNTWDARRTGKTSRLRFSIRVRTLIATEAKSFRKLFDQQNAVEPKSGNALAKELARSESIRVVELSDYGTVGLSGATRPDRPTEGTDSRFINFFFDIGRSHEHDRDAGTYGFGRSSLYTSGRTSFILADSLAVVDNGYQRRLMACRIGKSFEVRSGWHKGRYSGRHFWGEIKNGIPQPVTGRAAEDIAHRLGLPPRSSPSTTGTTILIPWPAEDFNDGDEISRTLLYHLWPKMVLGDGQPQIAFSIEIDGKSHRVPDPEQTDAYRLFVRALRHARTSEDHPESRVITTLRPRHTTGCLGLAEGTVAPSAQQTASDEDDDAPARTPSSALNSVALMRPSELVVCYLNVAGTELALRSWAGVFICSDDAFVRTAFSRAEPPAHDDWIADRLQERHEKYIVRKTVQTLIPAAVRDFLGVARQGTSDPWIVGHSLAGTAERFSGMFLSGDGQGPGNISADNGGTAPRTPSTGPRTVRLSGPVPVGLDLQGGRRIARFLTLVRERPGTLVELHAVPHVHAEGRLDDPPEGLTSPTVVGWRGGKGQADRCQFLMDTDRKEIEVLVLFGDDYGVILDVGAKVLES